MTSASMGVVHLETQRAPDDRGARTVEVALSPTARELVKQRGGTVAVDLIASVGCGKRPEVATDTYLRGKDTSSYLHAGQDGVEVLVSLEIGRASCRERVCQYV